MHPGRGRRRHWFAGWKPWTPPGDLLDQLKERGWHVYLSRQCAAPDCDWVQFEAGPRHPAEIWTG